jgi:hypothetical protein
VNDFQLNLVEWGDLAGLGAYEIGHYRQHRNYIDALAAQNIFIPDVPIMHMVGLDREQFEGWLNIHESLHEILRAHAGITGVNLSPLNLDDPQAFYNWQEAHAAEHRALDIAFGTT